MEILSYLPVEVTDSKEAGTVVLITPSPHTPEALTYECVEPKHIEVRLTKYKSYADAHLFVTE